MNTIQEQLLTEIDPLTSDQQVRLLAVARQLSQVQLRPGTPGEVLLAWHDRFTFAPGDVDAMLRDIEEGCEVIDWDGWR